MLRKKVITCVVAAVTALSMTAISFADTFSYTPINGPAATSADTFKFNKNLTMDKDQAVPAATFSFSVAPGAAVAAGTGTVAVKAGVGTPTIANVVYTANEQASANMTVATEGNTKTATKVAAVDFSGCSFTEPGIYRYIVTESGINQGVTNDSTTTRTLDVYVVNHSGNLKVDNYVFYNGTKTDAPSATATSATGKSTGFTNRYAAKNLTFGKEVKGNFGSLDQYFEYTVNIGNMAAGSVLSVDLSDADATPHASDANQVTTAANPTSLTVGTNGSISQKFYIHDGQYITIKGLPAGATYSVTENAHDYTSAAGIAAADNDEKVAHTDATSGTIANDNIKTGYTNTKDAVTPTGIAKSLTSFAPAGLIALLALSGLFMVSRRRKANK